MVLSVYLNRGSTMFAFAIFIVCMYWKNDMGHSYAVSPDTAIKGTLSNVQVTFAVFVEVLFTILFLRQ